MNIFASNAAETKGVGPELTMTRTELNGALNLTLELTFSLVIVVSIVGSDQLIATHCDNVK